MNTSFSLGKKTVLLIATLCLFSAIFAGAAAFLSGDQRVVYGVRAENCDLNGMSKAEARQAEAHFALEDAVHRFI